MTLKDFVQDFNTTVNEHPYFGNYSFSFTDLSRYSHNGNAKLPHVLLLPDMNITSTTSLYTANMSISFFVVQALPSELSYLDPFSNAVTLALELIESLKKKGWVFNPETLNMLPLPYFSDDNSFALSVEVSVIKIKLC